MSNKEASVSPRRSVMRSGNEDRSGDGLIPGAGGCMDARLALCRTGFMHLQQLVTRVSAHLPGLTSSSSADIMHGEKTGTHRSRTSPLPGSPLGAGGAFSITAATTHPASMLPPDGTSPLWRNVSRRGGKEGGGGGGEGGREGEKEG